MVEMMLMSERDGIPGRTFFDNSFEDYVFMFICIFPSPTDLDVAQISNMTFRVTRAAMVFSFRIEVGSDKFTIGSQFGTFVDVHSVHARFQTVNHTPDLNRTVSGGLFQHQLALDVGTIVQFDHGAARV